MLREILSKLTTWKMIQTQTEATVRDWIEGLADLDDGSLRRGLDRSKDHVGWFDISVFRSLCRTSWADIGVPSPDAAYTEAAKATSPVTSFRWSHPAVYHAGSVTGWFELRNTPEHKIKPKFITNYLAIVDRIATGEAVRLPKHPAIERKETPMDLEKLRVLLDGVRETLA